MRALRLRPPEVVLVPSDAAGSKRLEASSSCACNSSPDCESGRNRHPRPRRVRCGPQGQFLSLVGLRRWQCREAGRIMDPAGCPILLMGLLNPVRPVLIERRRVGSNRFRQAGDTAVVDVALWGPDSRPASFAARMIQLPCSASFVLRHWLVSLPEFEDLDHHQLCHGRRREGVTPHLKVASVDRS